MTTSKVGRPRTRVAVSCLVCGAIRDVKPSKIAQGGGKFCGLSCRSAAIVAVPVDVRVWARVNKDGPVPSHRPEIGPCWEWTGAKTVEGYGKISVNGRLRLVTHVVWEMAHNPLSDGDQINHRCDNPPCVRPDHLEAGDQVANMRGASERGRMVKKITPTHREEIRAIYASGEISRPSLAQRYGVTRRVIWLLTKDLP